MKRITGLLIILCLLVANIQNLHAEQLSSDKFIHLSDMQYTFDRQSALIELSAQEVDSIDTMVNKSNQELKLLSGHYDMVDIGNNRILISQGNQAYAGVSKPIVKYYWGYEVWLNHSDTNEMIINLNTAVGVGVIAAGGVGISSIWTGPFGVIVGAYIGMETGYASILSARLQGCDRGKGVIVHMGWSKIFKVFSQ